MLCTVHRTVHEDVSRAVLLKRGEPEDEQNGESNEEVCNNSRTTIIRLTAMRRVREAEEDDTEVQPAEQSLPQCTVHEETSFVFFPFFCLEPKAQTVEEA